MASASSHGGGAAANAAGVPIRTCARVYGRRDDLDRETMFISGNAMELVPVGQKDGERHTLTRIYDVHASDGEVCEEEVGTQLLRPLIAGENATLLVFGHHRAGHTNLHAELAHAAVAGLLTLLEAPAEGTISHEWKLSARYARAILGSDRMCDLFGGGERELRVLRDAEALGGVVLEPPGLAEKPITSLSAFDDLFRFATKRLAAHKPPPPSSLLTLELTQSLRRADGSTRDLASLLTIGNIEVGVLGDALSNGLRQLLAAPAKRLAPAGGAALLLHDSIGGNARTALVGAVAPADFEETAATLGMLSAASGMHTFPLPNDPMVRGLLQRHHWQSQQLQDRLNLAEGDLKSGIEQIELDRKHLPSQLYSTTERLQGIVSTMQEDAAGFGAERQALMREVVELRAKASKATGELVEVKEELVREKREKLELSRELLGVQLGSTEAAAAQQSRTYELEQQALASADVLEQLKLRSAELETMLGAKSEALNAAEEAKAQLEQARLWLQTQTQTLEAEAEEAREREDELSLELLNATNAQAAAEREAAALAESQARAEREAAGLRSRAAELGARGQEAAGEAERATSERQAAAVEREALLLQHQQDLLALQQQAATESERQLARVRELEVEVRAARGIGDSETAKRAREVAEARAAVEQAAEREALLRSQLDAHEKVVAQLKVRGGGGEGEEDMVVVGGRMLAEALVANRALVDAYTTVRAIAEARAREAGEDPALPSHTDLRLDELMGRAPGAPANEVLGVRESHLLRDKEALDARLAAARSELAELTAREQRRLAGEAQDTRAGARERERLGAELAQATAREEASARRVAELERALATRRGEDADAVKAQGELAETLRRMKGEEAEEGNARRQAAQLQKRTAELEAENAQLRASLEGGKGASTAGEVARRRAEARIQMQLRELVADHAKLERERTECARRAAFAEAQLVELQARHPSTSAQWPRARPPTRELRVHRRSSPARSRRIKRRSSGCAPAAGERMCARQVVRRRRGAGLASARRADRRTIRAGG